MYILSVLALSPDYSELHCTCKCGELKLSVEKSDNYMHSKS